MLSGRGYNEARTPSFLSVEGRTKHHVGCGEIQQNERKEIQRTLEVAARTHVVPEDRQRKEKQYVVEAESGSQTLRGRGTGKVERFRGQTVIDGSSMGGSGREAACGWAVAQLDDDEENELWRAGYGTMTAEPV